MITGKTQSGFSFKIQDSSLNNFELLDYLTQADEGNIKAAVHSITILLGDEQKKKLYDHVRLKDGTVPIEKVTNELMDIMKHGGERLKKSASSPQ
ncbi:MAG: hypothetical protein PT957_03875 [Firmicutes bacterium]|nr:hypothetical protein [Bacillota bacterium]